MADTLRLVAPFLGAGTLALVVYFLTGSLNLKPKVGRGLEDFYASAGNEQKAASRGEQIGNRVAERLPFSLDTWEEHLRWAQRGGYFKGWGIGRLVFTAMIYAGVGALVLLVNPAPASLLVPLGAAAYPFISIVHHLRSSEAHPEVPMALYRRVETAYLRSVDGFVFNSKEQ